MRRWLWPTLVITLSFSLISLTGIRAARADAWTKGLPIGTWPATQNTFEPFVLEVWGGDETHVYGLCTFYNTKLALTAIDGVETSNGDFYPNVIAQVSNDKRGTWETLKTSPTILGKDVTITVEAKGASRTLMVDLDVFRPFIGKLRYGRLLLKTGERATFELADLRPPKKD